MRLRLLLSIVASGSLFGCNDAPTSPGAPTSPLGTDASLYGEWDVNSLVPSDTVCTQAGIDEVEVVITSTDGNTEYTDPRFKVPCAAGYVETTPVDVLRAGAFGYRWKAWRGTDVVLESKLYTYTIGAGQELSLMSVDFRIHEPRVVNVTLSFQADIGTGTCATALVDQGMSWDLKVGDASGAVEASSTGTGSCADTIQITEQTMDSVTAGAHVLEVEASAVDGAKWAGTCAVDVPIGGPIDVTCMVPRAP